MSPRKSKPVLEHKIDQSRITVDPAENYLFALAVENCINGSVSSAAREHEGEHTVLAELRTAAEQRERKELVKNGSVIAVALNGFFPFEETEGLQPVSLNSIPPSPDRTERLTAARPFCSVCAWGRVTLKHKAVTLGRAEHGQQIREVLRPSRQDGHITLGVP